ncbi:MAG: acyl-ACP--UDP-N-acetylglucosamine O-acyltransferase [Bacteroidales bacterium]|nr:acyl-ACP--UDP-N-acetylglucosamine O-acyltransferase [Bacteroidales bacterium]
MMNNTQSYIHPDAKIGKDVEIGPFCYIAANVEIGDGCKIGPHATIYDYVKMGKGCSVFPGAVIGAIPQDLKFEGEETWVEIGDNTTIRECATINRGTAASGKYKTVVGSDCLIMSYVHIAHDCRVGNHCIFSSFTGLAGETDVDDWAILGGGALVHQFSHIGAHAMIGGGNTVTKDVPPYVLAGRNPVMFEGINLVGLRRRGFDAATIEEIKEMYRIIYGPGTVAEACARIAGAFPQSEHRDNILNFITASKRGIIKSAV